MDTVEINRLFDMPLMDLIYQAQTVHRRHFDGNTLQISTLLSIKTGSCPEDCAYCPQSGHYKTGVEQERLMDIAAVKQAAEAAKTNGATRFCLGAAWRSPPDKAFQQVLEMIKAVKAIGGMEVCVTLGMLNSEETAALQAVGLDYYNHNLDTSPEYYKKIITTRTYDDRLNTLDKIRQSDIKVCCGGIIGMGETRADRIAFLQQLANLPTHPESVPINKLIPIPGTPLGDQPDMDPFEFVRTIAVCRILMPKSVIRLSAGRESMSDELQALCFLAGANSVFYGEKLLTADNPSIAKDNLLFQRLGMRCG
jgi:biotin synthase